MAPILSRNVGSGFPNEQYSIADGQHDLVTHSSLATRALKAAMVLADSCCGSATEPLQSTLSTAMIPRSEINTIARS